jgi:hypothetical protein
VCAVERVLHLHWVWFKRDNGISTRQVGGVNFCTPFKHCALSVSMRTKHAKEKQRHANQGTTPNGEHQRNRNRREESRPQHPHTPPNLNNSSSFLRWLSIVIEISIISIVWITVVNVFQHSNSFFTIFSVYISRFFVCNHVL